MTGKFYYCWQCCFSKKGNITDTDIPLTGVSVKSQNIGENYLLRSF